MGIYKNKVKKKENNLSTKEATKKKDREKKKENKLSAKKVRFKKKRTGKGKTQIWMKHLAPHFLDLFNLVESTNNRNYYECSKVILIDIFVI